MLLDALGRGDEARADFDKALQLDPKDAGLYQMRATVDANHARWNEMVTDLSKILELQPEQAVFWYHRSLARLGSGQVDAYRTDCGEMLQRFGPTDKASDGHWVAWSCALAPDAITEWPTAIALAEQAVRSDSKSVQHLTTLGAVLYRAGRFDEALARLTEAAALSQAPSEASNSSPAYAWFFLAMAQHRLRHADEAKQWLDKAIAWTDKTIAEADQGTTDLPWNRRLTLKLLRDEATTLLGVTPPADEPVPEPAAKEEDEQPK
jgi:tetratricopeptide (TPR) repeat protein